LSGLGESFTLSTTVGGGDKCLGGAGDSWSSSRDVVVGDNVDGVDVADDDDDGAVDVVDVVDVDVDVGVDVGVGVDVDVVVVVVVVVVIAVVFVVVSFLAAYYDDYMNTCYHCDDYCNYWSTFYYWCFH
jgi:hypothetical protein